MTGHTTVFNYTLRSNVGHLDLDGRYSNPPAPMLQATGLFKEGIAHNEMEGFLIGCFFRYTQRHAKIQTRLTEPQGKFKK